MTIYKVVILLVLFSVASVSRAQEQSTVLLPDNDTILLTVFLKHDQSMNNADRGDILRETGFRDAFPPDGVEIVDHYVMMGIGQVIVLRLPPNHLRALNRAIEHTAWGAYETEFYITYDLAEARAAQQQQEAQNR